VEKECFRQENLMARMTLASQNPPRVVELKMEQKEENRYAEILAVL
jgi:hypothetical protein